jgi:hypothetical protein
VQKVPIFNIEKLSEAEKRIVAKVGNWKPVSAQQWFGTLYPYDVIIEDETFRFFLSQAEVNEIWTYAKIRNMGGTGRQRSEIPDIALTIDDIIIEEGKIKIRGESGEHGFNVDPEDIEAISKLLLDLRARVEALEGQKSD